MKLPATASQRLFGDAAWALWGQVGSGLFLLLGTRLLTELVAPDVFGQTALATGLVGLGVAVLAYPFICAGMRLTPEYRDPAEQAALFQGVADFITRVATPAVLGLIALGYFGAARWGLDPWLFVLAGLLLALTLRRELAIQLLIGQRRQRAASLWQTLDSLLRPALAIGAVIYGGANAGLILAGYALAAAITGLPALRYGASGRVAPPALRREILSYALPLMPMQALVWISGLGDRYVIGYYLTAADVGLYAAAYTLVNEAFNRSAMVLLRAFQPAYFEHIAARQEAQSRRLLMLWLLGVIALGIGGVGGFYLLGNLVAGLLLAPAYQQAAIALMPIIGAGCALQALAGVLSQPLLAAKRTRAVLLGHAGGAITALLALPLLVSEYGLPGAAWAAPVYFGIEALGMLILSRPWRAVLTSQASDIEAPPPRLNRNLV